jgi:hypothetical protein
LKIRVITRKCDLSTALERHGYGMVAALIRELSWTLVLGSMLYLTSAALLWFGRSPGRSVLPGVVYGLLPLTGGVIARLHSHVCMGMSCYSTCMFYCVEGVVIAGVLAHAYRSETRPQSVLGSVIALHVD